MTKGSGLFASGMAAFAGLIVLFFAGIVIGMIFGAWAFIAGIIAFIAVVVVEDRTGWSVTQENPAFIVPFMVAFLISGAAAFALDLVFKTYVSLPAMIDALDRLTIFEHARRERLIRSVGNYYALVLGSTPGTWLRFAGHYVVIVLVFAGVLYWFTNHSEFKSEPEPDVEPLSPIRRNLQLLGVSVVAVGIVAVTLFPLTTWAMLKVVNLTR